MLVGINGLVEKAVTPIRVRLLPLLYILGEQLEGVLLLSPNHR